MAKKNEMSKDMIDNIKNYSSEIRTLKDFVEAVRQNPGYHLGSIGNSGFLNMIREVLQNSLDEVDKDSSPCTDVWVDINEKNYAVTIIDNGRGIPHGHILRIFTNPNTSSNYDKKPGEYSSGLHGVGAKVTNAMSKKFIIESYILGKAKRVEMTEGYPWDKGEVDIPNKDNRQGTLIQFIPSTKALGPLNISWKEVYALVKRIIPLSKIGAVVHFSATDTAGKKFAEDIVNQDGVLTYIISTIHTPLTKPITVFKDTGMMKCDIAFTWDTQPTESENITAFANKCPTTLGTHIDGFVDGVSSFFVNYMNKIYMANVKKNKITIVKADVLASINAVVTVAHLHPIFDGQSKDKLSNEEIKPFVKNTVVEQLEAWSKTNPKDLDKIAKYIKSIAEIRLSTDKQKVKLSNNYAKSSLTKLPSKFVAPTGNPKIDKLEFFITEGDSAAGTMKNNRINKMQGYFPIRGKIPNAFKMSKDKFLANAEVSGIIQIIGVGYGKDIDLSKMKWNKIIIGTDADVDGDHIAALLLRFFILYLSPVIEAGYLYRAVPPLYGVQLAKGKYAYLKDRYEYIQYIQKIFTKSHVITTVDNKPISSKELSKILYTNIDYQYELDIVANSHAINPVLLDAVVTLIYQKASTATMSKQLKKLFKYLENISKVGDTLVIEGLVFSEYNTVFVNDTFIDECKNIFDIMKQNSALAYKVDGKVCSLYELMATFYQSTPKTLQRYKGLGEMDGKRLFDSTIDPNNRTLIQYTLEDAKAEVERIRYFENNTKELLTTEKVSRFDVMD